MFLLINYELLLKIVNIKLQLLLSKYYKLLLFTIETKKF